MFAKQVSSKEYDEKSKIQLLNMINSDDSSNKKTKNFHLLNKDDIIRQKHLLSLQELDVSKDKKKLLTIEDQKDFENKELKLRYNKLVLDTRMIFLEYEELKQNESKLNNKISKLESDIELLKEHNEALLQEAEQSEVVIEESKKNIARVSQEFINYKFRITLCVVLVCSIFISSYFRHYNYIW